MKADYGLRALLDLAEHQGAGPVPSHEIAARQHVPGPFLDQLLMTLRRSGLVHSTRGPRGGHVLARGPEETALAEVIDVLEGAAAHDEAMAAAESAEGTFGRTIHVALHRADHAARAVLEQTTLADLVREHHHEGVFHGIYHVHVAEGAS